MTEGTGEQLLVAPAAPRRRAVRTVRVALAGCGVVGGELVRLLEAQASAIEAESRVHFRITRVLVRHPDATRPVSLDPGLFTDDLGAFLAAEADLVVEAMGGLEPALQIARAALGSGRHFVTANKALLATHGPELVRLARRCSARLDFEGAVGGGIPVVRALRDSLARSGVQSVRGILNGTTNYILTRMGEGVRYADALAEAQARGFAEADPSRDVDGRDAADKIAVLAWLAFGVHPRSLPLRPRGIVPNPDRLAADAAAVGGVPRLVAECVLLPEGIATAVEPVIVAPDSELGRIRFEQNTVVVRSRWNGTVQLAGPGAGGPPTAAVLLADMVRGARAVPRCGIQAPAAVPDPRRHRWVLSGAWGAEGRHLLLEQLHRADVAAAEVQLDRDAGVVRVLTAPARRSGVERLARALAALGADPAITRYEVE